MPAPPTKDAILKRFRAVLDEIYVGLSASCCSVPAHGDEARADSDHDLAVFIKDLGTFGAELDRQENQLLQARRQTLPWPSSR
jgi:hypothetical protein